MVHAIHAGSLVASYKVCGFGNTGYDFSNVRYPGKLNNCEGCHLPDTYYPPDPATRSRRRSMRRRSTARRRSATSRLRRARRCARRATPAARRAQAHGASNGGSFNAVKDADSRTPGAPLETCGDCHGPGTGPPT